MNAPVRRPRRRHPVPVSLAVDVALIREGLSEGQYDGEVRRLVRKSLRTNPLSHGRRGPFPTACFDDELGRLLLEALGEN